MSARCPSDLGLEGYLLSPGASPLREHVGGCGACAARLSRMEEQGRDFRAFVFPATLDKVLEAAGRRRRWWQQWGGLPAPALVALAAALVMVVNVQRGPPADYVGTKGEGFGLRVYAGGEQQVRSVDDGAPVKADAALRFQVSPAAACQLWVVSVDALGQVSRLYPTAGNQGAPLERAAALPGGAVLDGQAGPERFFAVCSSSPLGYEAVAAAARRVAEGGERAVRGVRELSGLPRGTAQASVLVEKVP